jgi:hypothetical protein
MPLLKYVMQRLHYYDFLNPADSHQSASMKEKQVIQGQH